jgi:histone-lysine N-methyltransferase SETD2
MIQRARQLSDVIIIDATYKTNKYKMPFVNMVGVSNLGRDFKSLANFPIAGAWISSENEASYQWVMEQLEATVFPEGSSWRPGVTVTDQDQALMNAIDNVFPDAGNILCNLHIGRNFKKNIGPFVDEPEEKWTEIKKALDSIYRCTTMDGFFKGQKEYIALVNTNTKDKGKKAMCHMDRYSIEGIK